jgi:hypothetical protein
MSGIEKEDYESGPSGLIKGLARSDEEDTEHKKLDITVDINLDITLVVKGKEKEINGSV